MNTFRQMLILLLWTNLTLTVGIGQAQTTHEKGNNQTTITQLFLDGKPEKDLSNYVNKADYLKLNKDLLTTLMAEPPRYWNLQIPIGGNNNLELELEPNDILSPNFVVSNSAQLKTPSSKRAFYKGKVKGFKNTLVTISLFEDMVMGFVTIGNKDYILGHLDQDVFPAGENYIFYEVDQLKIPNTFQCGTEDKELKGAHPTENEMARAPNNIVDIYVEADYGLYQNKNYNQQTVTDYLTGLFNQMVALYAAENINVQLSEIFVWTSPDPYPSTSSSDALASFRDATGTGFNGDIALLAALDPGGLGGIAYLDVLCNRTYAKAYTDINASYAQVPTYSWSAMVITHEIGHNLGSRHTHACAWGPNENEAIDGCGPTAGYSEGCNADLPSNGGTMMSYCHLVNGVGINFNNGFGPNPGDKIRYEVSNASCLFAAGDKTNLDKIGTDNLTVNGTVLTVTHDVTNNNLLTADSSIVGYFLTPNTNLSTFDYYVGSVQLDSLVFNQSTGTITFSVDIDTISNIPPGSYYVGYILDYKYEVTESNENDNNYRFVGPQINKNADNGTCDDAFEIINNGAYATGNIDDGNGCHNCSGGAQHSRWYKFTAPANGFLDITSCFQGVNNRLWIYSGSCPSLTQVGSSDDYCVASSGGQPLAAGVEAFAVSSGTTYFLEWDNRWSNNGFEFEFSFYTGGEQCNVAIVIDNTGNYPKALSADGPNSGNGCYNCTNATHADWFEWTAPSNGELSIGSCNGSVDTRMWVYSGDCGSLTQVGSSDDDCTMGAGQQNYASEVLDLQVTAGTTYFIEWDNRWSNNGFNFYLDFNSNAAPPPSCTILSNPVFGATNVSVNTNFTWVAAAGNPTGYKLYAGYSTTGNEILNGLNVGNVTTYDPITLPYDTTVYVKIVPYNASGDATGCVFENFSTQIGPPECTNLVAPLNGATNVSVTAGLSWAPAAGNPSGYRLTVGYTQGGGEIMNNVNVGNVFNYNPGFFNYNSTVFVKIVPYNATGLATGCITESFTTEAPVPGCTTLSNPQNGATNVDVNTNISWNSATGNPTGYKITAGYTPGGGQITLNQDLGNVTTFDPGTLPFDTMVFVKITPYNSTGDANGCPEESFSTQSALPACTQMTNPTNGATGMGINSNIFWAAVNGATGYKISAGYSPTGTELANNQDVGNVLTFEPGVLPYNTTIFVSITPYNNTGDASGCATYSFTTQMPAPDCTNLTSPEDGESNVDVNADLTWNQVTTADGYRLTIGYTPGGSQILNNQDVGNILTYEPGSFLYDTSVFVKIVPYNAAGLAVGCSSEVFFTEIAPPGCTILNYPQNGSTGININASFSWNSVAGADGYKLTAGYSASGTEILNSVDVGNVTSYYPGTLPYNTTIFVKVIPYNNTGDAQNCSQTSYTTQLPTPDCTNLTEPENGEQNVNVNQNITWASVTGATGYNISIGFTPGGNELLDNENLGNTTTYDPGTLPFDTTVYVLVVPYNNTGSAAGCVEQSFHTQLPIPDCTNMLSPTNGAQNVDINQNISWSAVNYATGYYISMGTTPGGEDITQEQDLGNVTNFEPGTLPYNTTIFVDIIPYNSTGYNANCTTFSFTTQEPLPLCTSLSNPVNGATMVDVTTDLTWNTSSNADGYKLSVGYSQGGNEILNNQDVGNVTSFDPGNFSFDTTIFVKIIPYNTSGEATGCPTEVFETQVAPPGCTFLNNPLNGSTSVNIDVDFTWAPVSGVMGYKINAGYSAGGTDILNGEDVGNVTSYDPGTLPYNTTIFVKIIPYNASGEVNNCTETQFTTQVAPPDCTYLTNPENGAENVAVDQDLNWATSQGATGYYLSVGYTSGGNEMLDNSNVGNVTSYDPGNLLNDTTVFVTVIPYNATGNALGCVEQSFTTIPSLPACASMVDPEPGATLVPTDKEISWNTVPGATGYKVLMGSVSGGNNYANNVDVGNTTTYFPGSYTPASNVYVKIKPYNVAGVNESCPQKMFSVAPLQVTCTNLVLPQPGQTDVNVNLIISWEAVPYADGYKVNLGLTPNGGEILNDEIFTSTTQIANYIAPYDTTIYVKITPFNALGEAMNCSIDSFRTQIAPPACTGLSNPTQGAVNIDYNTNITWAAASGNPTGYKLSLGYTPNGTEILNNEDVGNVTTYNPADFPYDTTIYVKVIPYNGTGEASNCDVQYFRTEPAPANCSNLTSPLNGAGNVDRNADISWNVVPGASGYKINMGTSAGANDLFANQDVGNTTSFDPGLLPADADIYVRIIPYNGGGETGNCNEESFHTLPEPTSCTNLQIPQNGSSNVSVNTVIAWEASNFATGYKITIGYTPTGGEIVNNEDLGNVTSYNPGTLFYNATVYVTLIPYNAAGNANACSTESFTTQPALPVCTQLVNPANGSSNVSVNTSIVWNKIGNASGYKITVGYSSGGGEITANQDLGNDTTYTPAIALHYNSDVYVKITPYNSTGEASNCAEYVFSTEQLQPQTCSAPLPGNHTIGNISATLRWDTVPDALKYQVRYQVQGTDYWYASSTNDNEKELNWLFYNTTYEYQFSTLCPSGWTDWSPIYTFTTEAQEDCTLPLIVGTSVSDTSFTVTWLSVPNVSDQLIYYRMKGNSTWEQYNQASDTTFTATGLLPGNEYQFRFRVLCSGSWTTWSPILTLLTESGNNNPCQAPQPQLVEVGNTYADISWTAINDAIRYQIRYAIAGSGDWSTRTISNLTVTSLTWLVYNTNYEYQLRTECPSGWTDWSNSYEFTTLNEPACTLPTLTSQSVTETSFTVSWPAVPDVVELQVQYKRSGDATWTEVSLAQDTSFTATNLYPGNLYQFRLRVNCPQGWTGWTNLLNLMTENGQGSCNSPDTLFTNVENIEATIGWTAVNGEDKYQIRYRIQGEEDWLIRGANNSTITTLTWLNHGTTYEFELRALCSNGWTDWSQTYTFTTDDEEACSLPVFLSQSATETSFTVTWSSVVDVEQEIIMYRRTSSQDWYYDTLTNETAFTAENLLPGNLYQLRLRVKCPEGWTNWSSFQELMTQTGQGLCEAPDTIYVETANTDAEIAWQAVNGDNKYQIRYRILGDDNWVSLTIHNTTVANLTWLYFGTTYEFELRALCNDEWTEWSQTYTFDTEGTAACALPPFVSQSVTETSFTVVWNSAPDIEMELITYRRVGESDWTLINLIADTSFTAENLLPGNQYQFRFKVKCPEGWTGWSELLYLTTENGDGQCTAPELLATTVENINATISWSAVNGEDKYQIRYRPQGEEEWMTRSINNGTVTTLNWLYFGTTYEFELRALCANGWTDWSQTYTFTTDNQPACSLPTFVGSSTTESSFTVVWNSAPGIMDQMVMYRRSTESTWSQEYIGTDTTFTVENLISGNLYYFRFRVECPEGWTSWSDVIDLFTLVAPGNCEAPSPLFTEVENINATIGWNAVDGENRYQLRYRILGQNDWITRGVNNGTVINLDWLFYGTTYEYELRALCSFGWTDWSQIYTFTTLNDPACSLPMVTDTEVSETSFTVSWTNVPAIEEEIIMYRRKGESDWLNDTLTTDTFFTAENLIPGNIYQFRYRVKCPEGWTSYSNILELATPSGAFDCNIPDTAFTTIGSNYAIIGWTAEYQAERYQIRYKLLSESYWITRTLSYSTLYELSWLYVDEDYEYQLRAECTSGWTDWSDSYYFTTLADPTCTTPWITDASATDNSVTINWETVYQADEIHIRIREKGTSTWLNYYVTDDNTYTVTGLNSNTIYQYLLRSYCGNGWTGTTNLAEISTIPLTPGPGKNFETHPYSYTFENLELFPNPARHFINVKWEGKEGDRVIISNLNGVLIQNQTWDGYGTMQIDIQDLQPGMYLLTVLQTDGTKQTERFIKTN
jgi:hypothetical protein